MQVKEDYPQELFINERATKHKRKSLKLNFIFIPSSPSTLILIPSSIDPLSTITGIVHSIVKPNN
jgi:hypothetical protein